MDGDAGGSSLPGGRSSDPLSPDRVEEARRIGNARCVPVLEKAAGNLAIAKRQVYGIAQQDRGLRIALARVLAAEGQVLIGEPGRCIDQWPEAPHLVLPPDARDAVELIPAHDPLSWKKVAAAEEVFASAMMRALAESDLKSAPARRLLWARAKQDTCLHTAMVRLAIVGRQPVAIVLLPTVVEDDQSDPPPHRTLN